MFLGIRLALILRFTAIFAQDASDAKANEASHICFHILNEARRATRETEVPTSRSGVCSALKSKKFGTDIGNRIQRDLTQMPLRLYKLGRSATVTRKMSRGKRRVQEKSPQEMRA